MTINWTNECTHKIYFTFNRGIHVFHMCCWKLEPSVAEAANALITKQGHSVSRTDVMWPRPLRRRRLRPTATTMGVGSTGARSTKDLRISKSNQAASRACALRGGLISRRRNCDSLLCFDSSDSSKPDKWKWLLRFLEVPRFSVSGIWVYWMM